jgi:hypothetical protein
LQPSSLDFLPFDADAQNGDTTAQPLDFAAEPRPFAYVGQGLNVTQFERYVASYDFGPIPPDFVVLHHTAIPAASWAPSGDPNRFWDAHEQELSESAIYAKRRRQLDGIRNYYRDTHGWSAGPHLFIDERWIWLFTPMSHIGIHAASGNSYRDNAGRLHYSIGIEVVGYYDHAIWPERVQRLVGSAVVILQRRLKTFDLTYRPAPPNTPAAHVHSICSHRDFNKPGCPGAAITEAFYLDVIKRAAGEVALPAPADPLKVRQIAGATRSYWCGAGFYDYYQDHAGLRSLGYPLSDEFEATDSLGESCTLMRFERGVLKYKPSGRPWSIQPALLSELQKLGFV